MNVDEVLEILPEKREKWNFSATSDQLLNEPEMWSGFAGYMKKDDAIQFIEKLEHVLASKKPS